MGQHILVAVDGSELSTLAVQRAVELAPQTCDRVTIFYALPTAGSYAYAAVPAFSPQIPISTMTLEQVHGAIRDHAHQYLQDLVDATQSDANSTDAITMDWSCEESDTAYRAILQAANRLGCTMIVMASHGRRGLGALVLGSTTQKVLFHSTIPVLVVPPTAVAGAVV